MTLTDSLLQAPMASPSGGHFNLYQALLRIGHASLRESTRDSLCQEVCRAAVESGAFILAWIGRYDPDRKMIVPAMQWGDDRLDLQDLEIFTDQRPESYGPTGPAFRSDKPYICNNFLADPIAASWHCEAKRRGIRAAAAFPIRWCNETRGTLTVYAAEADYFQAAEIALLHQAVSDISYALDALSLEADRGREKAVAERMACMVESAHDAIISKSVDGLIDSWNPAAERMFGYLAKEAIGQNITMLIPRDRAAEQREILAQIAMGDRITDFETIRVRKDGSQFAASITVSPIVSDHGAVLGASKVVRNIEARKQAEHALSEVRAQLEAVVENLDIGLLIHDLGGRLVRSNATALKMMDFSGPNKIPADLDTGFAWYEMSTLDGSQLAKHERPVARLIRGDHLRDFEARVRRLDVAWERIFSYSGTRVLSAQGETLVFLTFKDITARKEAEQALRVSEKRLLHAQKTAKMGNWEVDVRTGAVYCSDQVYEIFGIAKQQPAAHVEDFLRRAHPDDQSRVETTLRAAISSGARLDVEFRLVLPDGRLKWVHAIGDLSKETRGRRRVISGTTIDITSRQQAATALRDANTGLEHRVAERTRELAIERDRAESADRLKSAFLATMSHELRTPLNTILGFTGIILRGMAGPLTAEQAKQLGMVQSSGRHLLSLINDVLDISKIEAGQLEIHSAAFDVRACVEKVLAAATPGAEQKSLRLVVIWPPHFRPLVSDERRVEQVLINLLNNAVKFTEHGEIELTVEFLDDPANTVRFRIRDTGIGIKDSDLGTLFNPFQQLDAGNARHHEGTGLGLAICRRLVDLLGGEIQVQSRLGVGSVFAFTVPNAGALG